MVSVLLFISDEYCTAHDGWNVTGYLNKPSYDRLPGSVQVAKAALLSSASLSSILLSKHYFIPTWLPVTSSLYTDKIPVLAVVHTLSIKKNCYRGCSSRHERYSTHHNGWT